MSYTFEKVTVKKWEVTAIYHDYLEFSSVLAAYPRVTKCEICAAKFKPKDMVHLAFVKGRVNHFICTKCKDIAKENGVGSHREMELEPAMPKFD